MKTPQVPAMPECTECGNSIGDDTEATHEIRSMFGAKIATVYLCRLCRKQMADAKTEWDYWTRYQSKY